MFLWFFVRCCSDCSFWFRDFPTFVFFHLAMSSPGGSGSGSGHGSGSGGKRGRRAKRASSSATRQQQQPATDPGAHGELLSLLYKSTSASSILRVRVPFVCPGG